MADVIIHLRVTATPERIAELRAALARANGKRPDPPAAPAGELARCGP